MRSLEPSALVRILAAVLEEQVIPAQTDRHAKSTLWMIVGLLDNVGQRISEDPQQVEFEESLLRGLLESAPESVAAHGQRSTKRLLSETLRDIARDKRRLHSPDVRQWLATVEVDLRQLVGRRVSIHRPTRYMRALDP